MEEAKSQFRQTFQRLGNREKSAFLKWIEDEFMVEDRNESTAQTCLGSTSLSNAEAILRAAAEEIRIQVPIDAIMKSEHVVNPEAMTNDDVNDEDDKDDDGHSPSSFDPLTSVHVDSFLYDDDAIDDLVEEGKFSRHYCQKCLSRDVSLLNFISHSASIAQIKYVIQALIPVALEHLSLPTSSLRFLDVGSRFGPFLLGASLFSSSSSSSSPSFSSIVGVEINSELCELQRRIIEKYLNPADAIPSVICSDVKDCPDVVARSDVIILHNVFQFFLPIEDQKSLWEFLFSTIRSKETLIITNPSIEESMKPFKSSIKLASAVKKVGVSPSRGFDFLRELKTKVKQLRLSFEDDELEDFHVYQVLRDHDS